MSEPLNVTAPSPLSGKRVVVTGGARGIGRELAVTMAAAGARVAVTARSLAAAGETVRAIEASGGQGCAFELDLADRASPRRWPRGAAEAWSTSPRSSGSWPRSGARHTPRARPA